MIIAKHLSSQKSFYLAEEEAECDEGKTAGIFVNSEWGFL